VSEGNNRDRTVAAGVSVLIAGRKVRSKKRMLADISGGPVIEKACVSRRRMRGEEWKGREGAGRRKEQGRGRGRKWMEGKEGLGDSVMVVVVWCRWLGVWLVTSGRWLMLVAK
jgi:hypothetical protein